MEDNTVQQSREVIIYTHAQMEIFMEKFLLNILCTVIKNNFMHRDCSTKEIIMLNDDSN